MERVGPGYTTLVGYLEAKSKRDTTRHLGHSNDSEFGAKAFQIVGGRFVKLLLVGGEGISTASKGVTDSTTFAERLNIFEKRRN